MRVNKQRLHVLRRQVPVLQVWVVGMVVDAIMVASKRRPGRGAKESSALCWVRSQGGDRARGRSGVARVACRRLTSRIPRPGRIRPRLEVSLLLLGLP